jgi:hypothetical protein
MALTIAQGAYHQHRENLPSGAAVGPDEARIHALRHSFATVGASAGFRCR